MQAEREDRAELLSSTGQQSIPVLVADGKAGAGEAAIVTYLNTDFAEPPEAMHLRATAAKAKREELKTRVCNWHQLHPSTSTSLSFDAAVGRVREELAAEGFGVLSEIDRRASHAQEKARRRARPVPDPRRLPPAAALETEPELGTPLPCNVVVYQQHGKTHISAIDADRMLSIVRRQRGPRAHRHRGATPPVGRAGARG